MIVCENICNRMEDSESNFFDVMISLSHMDLPILRSLLNAHEMSARRSDTIYSLQVGFERNSCIVITQRNLLRIYNSVCGWMKSDENKADRNKKVVANQRVSLLCPLYLIMLSLDGFPSRFISECDFIFASRAHSCETTNKPTPRVTIRHIEFK